MDILNIIYLIGTFIIMFFGFLIWERKNVFNFMIKAYLFAFALIGGAIIFKTFFM